MYLRPLFLSLPLLLLAACGDSGPVAAVSPPTGSSSSSSSGGSSGTPPAPTVVRFIALGDTGCGAQNNEQQCSSTPQSGNVAKVIQTVCAQRGCDFAVMAGDNIYEQGTATASDPVFNAAFRAPYAALNMPFLFALGNHDNSNTPVGEGNTNVKGDTEVAYAASAANTGKKWVMPNRYYRYEVPQGAAAPVLEFFVLDSSPISHFSDDPSPTWSGNTLQTYIADQMTFLNDGLASSKATWKFALAHHPYISNGQHGNAGNFDVGSSPDACNPVAIPGAPAVSGSATCRGANYKSFLENTICNKVDVFFTGHDHEMYWLKPVAACGKTEFILSGNGSKSRASQDKARNPVFYQADNVFGFYWVEINGNTMTSAAYRVNAGGTPADADTAGKPVPAFERSFTRTP